MDTADVVASFMTGSYAVMRRPAATYALGRVVPGATTPLTIVASVQPANGRDLLRLPEGRRSIETRVVFTATQLYVGAQGAPFEADLIAIDGQVWEVQHAERWESGDPAYWRCIAQATVGGAQVAV